MTRESNEKMSGQEHPDTQLTVRSIVSQRTVHRHEAIQLAELLHDRALDREHRSVQQTVRSMRDFMHHFEEKNMNAIELAWHDLSVFSGEGDRTLLTGASGKVQGSLLAIMGPSGAGKSTLMNVLACRMGGVKSEGAKNINGIDYSLTDLKQVSGYVMQDDLVNDRLTVEETLFYAAELRLPNTMSREEKQQRINEVLGKLGLEKCRDVVVGNSLKKGISGGERKRLCVAIELLTRPRLLFLDEPTSGLDSVTAYSLCKILRDLAHSGECTVVTTIHQPQTKIYQMFDDLILLKSGRIVYYGSAQQVTDFFAEAGFPCPDKTNPADHILDVITIVPTDPNSAGDVALAEAKLEELRNRRTELEIAAGPESSVQAVKAIHKNERSSWLHQFITLFRRSVQEQRRSPEILWTLIIQNIVMAVLIGTVFLQIGTGQPATTRILPVIFFCVINQGVFSSLMTINSFPKERMLVLRERAAGTYHASAYFLAKNLAEFLFQLPAPILFSCIVYWLIGLAPTAGQFFVFTAFMVLGSVAATSMALMVSALARTTDLAVTILPMSLEVFRLFGGFFLPPASLPNYYVWLDALSYVKYAYTAISQSQLSGMMFTCGPADTNCILEGQQMINQRGLDYISVGGCAGVLIAMTILYRLIAYLGVRFIKW